jgi:pimeloyl-ACP methyl ester carboxylesterase
MPAPTKRLTPKLQRLIRDDATRGLRDLSDDVLRLPTKLNYDSYVLVGHGMGGGVALQLLLDAPSGARVGRVVLVGPVPHYGFGGTKDIHGTPCLRRLRRVWCRPRS